MGQHTSWLDIPLADYEAHMALPEVGQARMLADELAALLKARRPGSIAIMGCAGGNGFAHIDARVTARVIGVDINPDYIEATRNRFHGRFDHLQLLCEDASSAQFDPVELVFAGLIFEYTDPCALLRNLARNIRPEGVLAVILQLASPGKANVTPSPYKSLEQLAPIMQLVRPETLIAEAAASALRLSSTRRIELDTGKSFQSLVFEMSAERV